MQRTIDFRGSVLVCLFALVTMGSGCSDYSTKGPGADSTGGSSDVSTTDTWTQQTDGGSTQTDTVGSSDTATAQDAGSGHDGSIADTQGEQDGSAADVSTEDVATEDTGAEDAATGDAGAEDAAIEDTTGAEDAAEDTTGENDTSVVGTCEAGLTCPAAPQGEPDIEIVKAEGDAPVLTGGPAPSGTYNLDKVEIYLGVLMGGSPLVDAVGVASQGNTYGSVIFEEEAWGISANLDIGLELPVVNESLELSQDVTGGGCFSVDASQIVTDILECYDGDGGDITLPGFFDYETGEGTLTLMLSLPNEDVLTSVPEEYMALAGGLLTGDLPIVLQFSSF